MKTDGSLPRRTKLRSSKYLNNVIEQDHRHVKSRVNVMLGFKRFRNAAVTLSGIELMHRIRKGQFDLTACPSKIPFRPRFGWRFSQFVKISEEWSDFSPAYPICTTTLDLRCNSTSVRTRTWTQYTPVTKHLRLHTAAIWARERRRWLSCSRHGACG
jgi:hypothetical protein